MRALSSAGAQVCNEGDVVYNPTIAYLLSTGLISYTQNHDLHVKFLSKVMYSRVAFRSGDVVRCALKSRSYDDRAVEQQAYLCVIHNLLHINNRITIFHMGLVQESPVTWSAISQAKEASLTSCVFMDAALHTFTLLHPISRPSDPGVVTFLHW